MLHAVLILLFHLHISISITCVDSVLWSSWRRRTYYAALQQLLYLRGTNRPLIILTFLVPQVTIHRGCWWMFWRRNTKNCSVFNESIDCYRENSLVQYTCLLYRQKYQKLPIYHRLYIRYFQLGYGLWYCLSISE